MLTQLVVWLNGAANLIAGLALAPIGWLPGWLSAALIAAATGVLMLLIFKHTSNQPAIRRARDQIKANLLALSLFKDSAAVSLRAQARVLGGAGRLFVLSLAPIAVMAVPMCLLLAQLAQWYQARPLRVGEEAVVTVEVTRGAGGELDGLRLLTPAAFVCRAGPVRVPARDMACWEIEAREPGVHELSIEAAGRSFRKELVVGDGFLPTSPKRPRWSWTQALLYPREKPFAVDSPVQSIEIAYPDRVSRVSGTDSWLVYWFLISLAAAFLARPLLKVNI